MKTEEYVSAIKNMQAFSDLVESIYPDQYKFVCQQHDIPEREAMDMYGYLRKIACGQYWCVDNKPDGYFYTMVSMAKEARKLHALNSIIKTAPANDGDRKQNILAIFLKNGEWFQQEFDLQWQATFVEIAEMIKNGYELMTIARQVDSVDAKDYVGKNGKEIFEGDILEHTQSHARFTVMFDRGAFFIQRNGTENTYIYLYELSEKDKSLQLFEVVGNKFDTDDSLESCYKPKKQ